MEIKLKKLNTREKMVLMIVFSVILLLVILSLSFILSDENLRISVSKKNLPPSFKNLFGTDWLGRDMFTRTIKGLRLSLSVGAFASIISVAVATVMGMCAATFGRTVDAIISWFIDLFIGMPHIVFMVLICFIAGGGYMELF